MHGSRWPADRPVNPGDRPASGPRDGITSTVRAPTGVEAMARSQRGHLRSRVVRDRLIYLSTRASLIWLVVPAKAMQLHRAGSPPIRESSIAEWRLVD